VPNGGSTILSFLEVRWGKHIEPVEGDHTGSKRLPLAALRDAIAEQQDEGWLGRGAQPDKSRKVGSPRSIGWESGEGEGKEVGGSGRIIAAHGIGKVEGKVLDFPIAAAGMQLGMGKPIAIVRRIALTT
jgi:hypothetical protein